MRKRTRARRPFTSIVGLALTLLLLAPAGMSSATAATIAAQTPAITANETAAQSTQPFTDVRPGRDFYDEISWMAASGISNGWTVRPGVKEYRPNERVLRDQMAAFMYRLAGSPEFTAPTTSPFTDIRPGQTFYKEIAWLADQGISNGWAGANGTRQFRPGQPVLRDQMAAFMYRLAGSPEFTPPKASRFTDIRPGQTFYKEIAWLAESGVSNGWASTGGTRIFGPGRPVLRDQMAAFMYRLDNKGLLEKDAPAEETTSGELSISEDSLVAGIAGLKYVEAVQATGGQGDLTWSASGLPAGLQMEANGVLTGTPEATGSSKVTFTVTDSDGATDTTALSLDVLDAIEDECSGQPCSVLTPADGTVEVDSEQVIGMVRSSVTGSVDSVTLHGTAPSVGAVLVLPPTTDFPTGVIVRVDRVKAGPNGSVVAGVTHAKISDAYPKGSLHAMTLGPVDPVPTTAVPGSRPVDALTISGAAAAAGAPNPTAADDDHEVATCGAGASASVDHLSVSPQAVDHATYAKWGGLEAVGNEELDLLNVSLVTDLTIEYKVSASGKGECTLEPFEVDIPISSVGPVPVKLTMAPLTKFEVSGGVETEVKTVVTCGFTYRNIGGVEIRDQYCAPKKDATTAKSSTDAAVETGAAAGIRVTLSLNDFVGAGGEWTAGLYTTYAPFPTQSVEMRLKSGVEVSGCLMCNWEYLEAKVVFWEGEFYDRVIWASDGNYAADPHVLSIIAPHASFGTVGGDFRLPLQANGGTAPYRWAVEVPGRLPAGVALDATNGVISGVPRFTGATSFTVLVTDQDGEASRHPMTITIADSEPPVLTDAPVHPTDVGRATERTFFVTGGTKPFTFTRTAGAFPPGMSLDAATGKLTGTPTKGGEYEFTVKVTDATGKTDTTSSFIIVFNADGSMPAQSLKVKSISSHWRGKAFVASNGTVWEWAHDQMMNDLPDRPVRVDGITDATKVSNGSNTTYALRADRTVWGWGWNIDGELANPDAGNFAEDPVRVGGLTDVVDIATTSYASFALRSDGTVWSWGRNNHGLLGTGKSSQDDVSTRAVQVPNLANVTSLEAGDMSMYAVTEEGAVWSWGDNFAGQLGDGTETLRASPVRVVGLTGVSMVAAGSSSAFALKKDGTVWSWGNATGEQPTIGGPRTDRLVPARFESLAGFKYLAMGTGAVYAVSNDGTVWVWGYGQNGRDMGTGRNWEPYPVQIPGLEGIASTSAGDGAAFAIETDGTLWGWGHLGPFYGDDEGFVPTPIRLTY